MFQKFATLSYPETAKDRVQALRGLFDDLGVDAVFIPKSDEYLGEYIPPCAERLAWLTSFTGSAGNALIMRDKAIVFTDGRYTAQIAKQCDATIFSYGDLASNPPAKWLTDNGPQNIKLGIDPWILPGSSVEKLKDAVASLGGELIMLASNPIDAIWHDQPNQPLEPTTIQPLEYSGKLAKHKVSDLVSELQKAEQDALIIADPTAIAWVFNIRGNDVMHTPVSLSRAIIHAQQEPQLFIDKRKLDIETEAYLTQIASLCPPSEFDDVLAKLGKSNLKINLDPDTASHAISMILKDNGAQVSNSNDPVSLPRAIKNSTEIEGSIQAHKIDGAAMVSFISWLKQQEPNTLDEITVAKKLGATRADFGKAHQNPLKDISFDTISGSGPNAAIIHYRVDEGSNRQLKPDEMILVDSGGQYVSGTTDITRTIGLGSIPDEQKKFFTLVLRGMIEISMLRFPKGTRGIDIDAFARSALWKAGVDYVHGTGHGVGSYLSVHEGPQSISKRSMIEFEPGMILSNEPGYYRDGAFGIRIENLVFVNEPADIKGGETTMLGFETLTLCPIEIDLIQPELLTSEQINWLNDYHEQVYQEISPLLLDDATVNWLRNATLPIVA